MSRTIIIKTGFALVCVILVGGCSLFNPMSSLYGTWVNTSTTSGYSYTWQFNSDETFSNTTVAATPIFYQERIQAPTRHSLLVSRASRKMESMRRIFYSLITSTIRGQSIPARSRSRIRMGAAEQYTKSGSGGGTSGGTTAFGFWSDVGNEGTITIYVNGTSVGGLTHYFSSQPSWGSYGMLIITSRPGLHSFRHVPGLDLLAGALDHVELWRGAHIRVSVVRRWPESAGGMYSRRAVAASPRLFRI